MTQELFISIHLKRERPVYLFMLEDLVFPHLWPFAAGNSRRDVSSFREVRHTKTGAYQHVSPRCDATFNMAVGGFLFMDLADLALIKYQPSAVQCSVAINPHILVARDCNLR